jgi:O-antigen biosynthesis protein
MTKIPLITAASFNAISLEYPDAWVGHLPFASWLIREVEPKIFIELGTHSGNSYFSFCQSVVENGLASKCYAVDTWQGDEHAGQYGSDVFSKVFAHHQTHYAGFSRLLRTTFDDATAYFADKSIDLLHIDGLHTYEAVRHDFETWLPKLAPGAVVLFHDINVREREFGVWKLWEELQLEYPNNLEFVHSHGLGVLQLNDAPEDRKFSWLRQDETEKSKLITYFTALGLCQLDRYELRDLRSRLEIAQQALADRDDQVSALSSQHGILAEQFTEKDRQIATLDQKFREFTEKFAERAELIADLEQQINQRDETINQCNETINQRNETINQRDETIRCLSAETLDFRSSTSWKLTSPVRLIGHQIRRTKRVMRLLPTITRRGGGLLPTAKKAISVLRYEGIQGIKQRLSVVGERANSTQAASDSNDYSEWIRRYDTLDETARERIRQQIDAMQYRSTISVIMPVFDPPIEFLEKAIWSVRHQLYPHWELCIVDDASKNEAVRDLIKYHAAEDSRIKPIFRSQNGHISKASNSALEIATGEFIAMFDHDDQISEHALYLVADKLNHNSELDFLYSDQDKIDIHGVRYDPYFKPEFNPDLLRSQNFVDHLAVFRTDMVRRLGGWRTEFDGSQDYDLVLRFTEQLSLSRIAHIPYVLYHWRAVPGSLAIDPNAKNYAADRSRQALREHLQRLSISAEVTSNFPNLSIHRVVYSLSPEPLVSIIIPTKDGVDILRQCIDGLFKKTNYQNFEVIIVNNQSEKPETLTYLNEVSRNSKVRIINYDHQFNYSRINNVAVREANGSVLLFLNNDIEVINADWLREMVSHAVRPEIGAVGARLYYPDGTVQHAGVLLGYKGRAGHMYRYASPHWLGYWARGVLIQNLTAVTAACMAVRKEIFEAVGGFDEKNYTVTFNDVDLCLRIHEQGYRNLYTPYAELYHHESKTRGLLAFQSEEDFFSNQWKSYIENDPAYNPNLSLKSEDFSLSFPPRTNPPWLRQDCAIANKARPLVTIITRTHGDRQEFLREAIASVFAQSYRPIQIVVVEDGSEKARSLIESMAPPDGIAIDYKPLPKLGRCYAGNQGMELARGELFGFLDDDDLLLPDHIESLVNHLNNHPFAVGAYSCSWEAPTELVSLSPLKYIEGPRRLFGRADFNVENLWNYNFIAIQSFLLKKELYLKYGGFKEDLDCLEDWDLWIRYTAEKDFVFLDKPTSVFRMPKSPAILSERRKQHLQYLPVLRARQRSLLEQHKSSASYTRLKVAFDSIVA